MMSGVVYLICYTFIVQQGWKGLFDAFYARIRLSTALDMSHQDLTLNSLNSCVHHSPCVLLSYFLAGRRCHLVHSLADEAWKHTLNVEFLAQFCHKNVLSTAKKKNIFKDGAPIP